MKLPYSQPWYRPQLEETLEELERSRREVLKLKEVVASIAKERDAAQDVGRRSSEIIIQKTEEIKVLQQRIVDSAEQNTRERFATEAMHKEREQMVADNAKLKGRIHTLNSELENLKTAMSSCAARWHTNPTHLGTRFARACTHAAHPMLGGASVAGTSRTASRPRCRLPRAR